MKLNFFPFYTFCQFQYLQADCVLFRQLVALTTPVECLAPAEVLQQSEVRGGGLRLCKQSQIHRYTTRSFLQEKQYWSPLQVQYVHDFLAD